MIIHFLKSIVKKNRRLPTLTQTVFCFFKKKLPAFIAWEFTYKCNLKCIMCPFYGLNGTVPKIKRELSLKEITYCLINIKKTYKNKTLPNITFVGGEPLLKYDIIQILEKAKEFGFSITLISNFSTPNKSIIKNIALMEINTLMVSIDGFEKTHDKIRGQKGLYQRVVTNLKYFKKHNKTTKVIINSVLTKHNPNDIPKIMSLAKENNCELQLEFPNILDKKTVNKQKQYTKKIYGKELITRSYFEHYSMENIQKIKDILYKINEANKSLKLKINFLPNINIKDINTYYTGFDVYFKNKCFWNFNAVRINPEGYLQPCIDYIYGDLLKMSFKKAFFSKNAKFFRKKIKEELMPGCSRCCKMY